MNMKQVLADLYYKGKITKAELMKAVYNGQITQEDFNEITGGGISGS